MVPFEHIAKVWEYKGFPCFIREIGYTGTAQEIKDSGTMRLKWLCGYVAVNYMENISDRIECHGGITYESSQRIGFDCAHFGDTMENCDMEFCIAECHKIVDQLI